jgi:hypothetical protein
MSIIFVNAFLACKKMHFIIRNISIAVDVALLNSLCITDARGQRFSISMSGVGAQGNPCTATSF